MSHSRYQPLSPLAKRIIVLLISGAAGFWLFMALAMSVQRIGPLSIGSTHVRCHQLSLIVGNREIPALNHFPVGGEGHELPLGLLRVVWSDGRGGEWFMEDYAAVPLVFVVLACWIAVRALKKRTMRHGFEVVSETPARLPDA